MIGIEDLAPALSETWFVQGYAKLERNLLLLRLGLEPESLHPIERSQLARFSQAVIAGAALWKNPRAGPGRLLCQAAADIEASFAATATPQSRNAHLSLLKAVILYDLAGLPGASSTYAARNGFDPRFRDFFTRDPASLWGQIADPQQISDLVRQIPLEKRISLESLVHQALGEVAQEAGVMLQAGDSEAHVSAALRDLGNLAGAYDLLLTGDDFHALSKLIELREQNGTLRIVERSSNLSESAARHISLPIELWPAQIEAISKGILERRFKSFGFAAPTGTGKTALTRLVIADALAAEPGKKVLYVCPSRALVRQVSMDLATALSGISARVVEAGAHLTVHHEIPISPEDAEVLVFTPERADLLLRIDPEFLQEVCLVIVDEAHHIEQIQRGVLLEFYLWRLKQLVPKTARIVQLSAVAPNIAELTDWLADQGNSQSVMVDWRTSRLRVGVIERAVHGAAILRFESGPPYTVLGDGELPKSLKEGLAVLAHHLSQHGIVLVLCTSPKTAEDIAELVSRARRAIQETSDDASTRLDAWIERELYPECPLREYYKKRVVYHHAQIPPRIRSGIEEAIKAKKVDVICATTTLAEGVNFPFSTVIVESLVGKNYQISPRSLWNIAGRAGRFGVDTEGHCILFRPELWKDRLRDYALDDYLRTRLVDIPPVISGLASGIVKLKWLLDHGKIASETLESISLSEIKVDGKATDEAKEVRAFINIMRVGYAHASSSGIVDLAGEGAPEFEKGLLASRQLGGDVHGFSVALGVQQRSVVRRATDDNAEFVQIAARVGWSLEAQKSIYEWLTSCQTWQLEQFGKAVIAGSVRNFDRLGYLIGPLAKNLLAFEGQALGGFTSFIAQKWIQGIPLSGMGQGDYGRLVNTIYGRIQYLLPWGLFGLHELLEYEAQQRGISVGTGVRDLSVLAAEGVPDFDALQLVMQLGVERVDAARLSHRYRSRHRDTDILRWFLNSPWMEIERVVRGSDNRRIDPALSVIHAEAGSVSH